LALVLVLVAILSKLVGCGLAAIRLGKVDALRIGIGMIPRGEVGMVVAQFGLALGVIDRSVYSVVVLMAVATTVIPLPFLKLAYVGVAKSSEARRVSITS
jgi:Kef-type K+ transport system membrane component KefB